MAEKKMISIDQFNPQEREAIEALYKGMSEKYQTRTGKPADAKKDKEFIAEARHQIMAIRKNKEQAAAEKARKKPLRRKKPESQLASEVSDFNWSASVAKGRRQ